MPRWPARSTIRSSGFALNGNVAGHPKYPYNPYYKEFSPRIAAAWNPNFDSGCSVSVFGRSKTVVRGGYSILYGRLNGVGLVLVPLLGYGFDSGSSVHQPGDERSHLRSIRAIPHR